MSCMGCARGGGEGDGGEVLWYTCNLIAVVLFDTPHSLRYHAGLDLEWFNVALMRMRCIGLDIPFNGRTRGKFNYLR